MVSPITYLKQVGRELKKVTWPTRAQTIEMTVLVIGVTVIIAIYIGALDFLFQKLMSFIVTKV